MGMLMFARSILTSTGGTLRGASRVFALVWGASRSLTALLFVATVLAGLIPAAQAYAAKLLINAVVRAILIHTGHQPDHLTLTVPLLWGVVRTPILTATGAVVVLAALQFAIAGINSLLQTISNISQQLLQERVSNHVQLLIMEHAASQDLSFFEDAHSYDILQQAQREATSRPVMMVSGTFGLLRTLLTFLTMIALLIGLSPWLALIALVAP